MDGNSSTVPNRELIRETSQPSMKRWGDGTITAAKAETKAQRDSLMGAFKKSAVNVSNNGLRGMLIDHMEKELGDDNLFLSGIEEAVSALQEARKSYMVSDMKQLKEEKDKLTATVNRYVSQYNDLLRTQRAFLESVDDENVLSNVLKVVKIGTKNLHTLLLEIAKAIRNDAWQREFDATSDFAPQG